QHQDAEHRDQKEQDQGNNNQGSPPNQAVMQPPLVPGVPVVVGNCANQTGGGSICTLTAQSLNGAQIGGIPLLTIRTKNPITQAQTNETNPCGPITASLGASCNFHLT